LSLNTTDKTIKTIAAEYANTSRDTQLNQNSATVSHVNRDNFKLNAVYDVKNTNTLKLLPKQIFTLLTVMSLLQVPLAAMALKQTRAFVYY
jgi:hypothetical protein